MGSKVSMPAAPPPPPPVDPGQSAINFTKAMADPELQGQILASEQQYRPQYADLNLADMNTYLLGSGEQKGFLDLTDEATQRANTLASQQLSQQRAADISDVEALGGRASAAFMSANPELRSQLEFAKTLRGGEGGTDIERGELGDKLYGNALAAEDLGLAGQELDQRAQELAQSEGKLTPAELRQLQQSSRAGYAARGREMGAGSVAGEAFARYANERQNKQQDLSLAAMLNQGNQQEIGANRAFQGQTYGQDLARQQANQQFGANRADQDRSYALALANMQQGVASDPFQAILGRPSQSQAAGLGSAQFASGLAGQNMGPMLFDPNAGINLALQNNANQANYQSSIYGAQAGYAGATNQGRGSMIGGALGGIGALAGGALKAKTVMLCVPEGESIDTVDGSRSIEDLRAGDKVIGFNGDVTVVHQKHEYRENPNAERFHKFSFDNGTSITVCDMHRIANIRAMDYIVGDAIGDNTITSIDIHGGVERSYDILTDDNGYRMSGIPVNSMIEELSALSQGNLLTA